MWWDHRFLSGHHRLFHVIPVSIALDLISFVAQPGVLHLTQLQLDGAAHVSSGGGPKALHGCVVHGFMERSLCCFHILVIQHDGL